jgi:hypothetical protein
MALQRIGIGTPSSRARPITGTTPCLSRRKRPEPFFRDPPRQRSSRTPAVDANGSGREEA